jgi:hypothetical protein
MRAEEELESIDDFLFHGRLIGERGHGRCEH